MKFSRSFEYSTGCSKVKIQFHLQVLRKHSRLEIDEGCQTEEIKLLNLYVP